VEQHLEDWLRPRLGPQVDVVLALWRNAQAGEMLAIGLVCALLYAQERRPGRQAMDALLLARGRFSERLLGGAAIAESTLAGLGSAAVAHLERSLAANPRLDIGPVLDAAEHLLASLDLTHLAADSDLLPKGYELRLAAFTQALKRLLDQPREQVLDQAVQQPPKQNGHARAMAATLDALARLERHRLADQRAGVRAQQVLTARMALRACQWLATDPPGDATPAATIQDYVANGGWLDWARSKLWRGDAHAPLSRLYQRLSARLAERREAFNQVFARHLPAIARGDRIADWALPIEAALADRVAPLAGAGAVRGPGSEDREARHRVAAGAVRDRLMAISSQRRADIIDALRRGTVPEYGLDALAVGLDAFEAAVDAELERAARGRGQFKAVRGEYGSGKTFLARWLRERGHQRGFACAEVQISETETPLHRLETVYRRRAGQEPERAAPADGRDRQRPLPRAVSADHGHHGLLRRAHGRAAPAAAGAAPGGGLHHRRALR
jgi:hypothetical protein